MSGAGPLVVDVAEIRRRTGSRRPVEGDAHLDGLAVTGAEIVDGWVELDLVVESVVEGLVVTGRVGGRWRAACRRCLEPVQGPLDVVVREVFETHPTEGETWPIEDERIDLEPLVREAAVLALPLAPLCGPDCAGPDPGRFPALGPTEDEVPRRDPRWAALDQLREEAPEAE